MSRLNSIPSRPRSPLEQWPVDRVREMVGQLGDRELLVLQSIAAGETNAEIASRLGISEKAAEKHVSKLYSALGVPRRLEAAIIFTIYCVSQQLNHPEP